MLGTTVEALTVPTFPSCLNPQGSTKISYEDGIHGIIGSSMIYTGSDTVYQIDDDTLTQCFCASNGQGIQTNWWKASSLNETDIQILRKNGWFFAPNGALWGLDQVAYLAQNISYSCTGTGGAGGLSQEVGSALGTATSSILGLASTGNLKLIFAFFGLGLTLIATGYTLRRNQ